MSNRLCIDCKIKPTATRHFNCKRCAQCRDLKLKRPAHNLTAAQIKLVKKLAGTLYQRDVADRVGCSRSSLIRWARDAGISLNAHSYPKDLKTKVTEYYEKAGMAATANKFPDVAVRSIVERSYGQFKPRQIRWTHQQIHQLAKFAGIISFTDQAKFFARPGAHVGAIRSVWMKRFRQGGGSLNGMSACQAKLFVSSDCPFIETDFWTTRRLDKKFGRKLYLWSDMEKFLTPECPEFVSQAIHALADFQRWIFGTPDVRGAVLQMINEVSGVIR